MALEFGQEDQQRINTFSRLNTRLHELESTINIQQVRVCLMMAATSVLRATECRCSIAAEWRQVLLLCATQSNVDDLEDASNELMLVDDEEARCWR